jgi:hypothetical protein
MFHSEGITQIEGVWEQGPDEFIGMQERRNNKNKEKTA